MASSGQCPNTTPDLASILRTLASFAPQNQQHSENNVSSDPQSTFQFPARPTEQARDSLHYTAPTLESFLPTASQLNSNSKRPTPAPKINVDPTVIVEWSAGLKHVMKTVTKHENIIHEIRRVRQNRFPKKQ